MERIGLIKEVWRPRIGKDLSYGTQERRIYGFEGEAEDREQIERTGSRGHSAC